LPFNGFIIRRFTTSVVRKNFLLLIDPQAGSDPNILVDQWMVVMSTQLIGFSIGGIARRFLVQPPSMSE